MTRILRIYYLLNYFSYRPATSILKSYIINNIFHLIYSIIWTSHKASCFFYGFHTLQIQQIIPHIGNIR